MSPLSRERGQTIPEFFLAAPKNIIGFSCQERSFFVCWSQIRSPQNSTSTIQPFYSTVITPHGT